MVGLGRRARTEREITKQEAARRPHIHSKIYERRAPRWNKHNSPAFVIGINGLKFIIQCRGWRRGRNVITCCKGPVVCCCQNA